MYPSIDALAQTMRSAIAQAFAEGTNGTTLLGNIDLGLQTISGLTRTAGDPLAKFDLSSLPAPHILQGGDLPDTGAGAFEEYLRSRTGTPSLRLDAVERISGGFSRDMIRLCCTIDGARRDIVLRREVPGGLLEGIGVNVAGEYPLMQAAQSSGVPVAAPLWLETDSAILGQPFIAMDCAAGICLGTSLGASDQIAQPQLQALAVMLATLHRVEWRQLVLSDSRVDSPAAAATALLDQWESYWRATPMSPAPLLDQGLHWLRDHLPNDGLGPCLTHGDVGFHNIMADEHGFSALLDWEMAVIASPAKDLAHVRPSVEHMVDWGRFIGWYHEAGGAKIAADELRWFEIFRAFSMTLVCHVALAKLSDPMAARIDYFRLAFLALPIFSEQLAALLSVDP